MRRLGGRMGCRERQVNVSSARSAWRAARSTGDRAFTCGIRRACGARMTNAASHDDVA